MPHKVDGIVKKYSDDKDTKRDDEIPYKMARQMEFINNILTMAHC